ncbi:hypothetical protein M3Y94_00363700 [Aphelenchoides besseyi]|nr:hypothetical protein M3Y94_00363700 [Aphelenchoides besseyi]KAI6235239.1 hypothetical protein M3Y95_00030400 [Aphelenchoides besseyi]
MSSNTKAMREDLPSKQRAKKDEDVSRKDLSNVNIPENGDKESDSLLHSSMNVRKNPDQLPLKSTNRNELTNMRQEIELLRQDLKSLQHPSCYSLTVAVLVGLFFSFVSFC